MYDESAMTLKDLQKLFDNPVDYSENFNSQIRSLANEISRLIGVGVYHDEDMNYSAAQRIHIWFDELGNPCPREEGTCRFELRFYFSSKGKTFCSLCLE